MAVKKDEKSGKWYCYGKITTLLGTTRQYKQRGFQTKKEAMQADLAIRTSNKTDTSIHMTLDELEIEMTNYSHGRKKLTTIEKDESRYRLHIQPYFGRTEYQSIKVNDILKWQRELLYIKKLSIVNINTIMKTFNKYFTYAEKMYQYSYNPVHIVGKLKEPKREYVTWDIPQFYQFMKYVEHLKYQVAYRVLYFSGIRRGEFLALTWKDFNGRSLNINKTCSHTKQGTIITEPKTENSYRIVDLDSETIRLLFALKEVASKEDGFQETWYIFGNDKPMSFNALTNYKNAREVKAGVPHIRIHDFRHSHISLLINKKVPLPAIAERAGDTLDTILKTYAHLFKESNKELMNVLENASTYENITILDKKNLNINTSLS